MGKKRSVPPATALESAGYAELLGRVAGLLEAGRRSVVRSTNVILTATYWEIGRQIVEFEQGGAIRAEYGAELIQRLSKDLTARFGRGFSRRNVEQMRVFYLAWQIGTNDAGRPQIRARTTTSAGGDQAAESPKAQTVSAEFQILTWQEFTAEGHLLFPLPWSHYARLMSVADTGARAFYEDEAIRGNWSVRELDRQISSQLYERLALSRNKATLLGRARESKPGDAVTLEETIRDPYVLEFLDLKDEYSETDLEAALIAHLEAFLLELGAGFTFVGRQKRLRVGNPWYRLDLLLFHRRLRCLVLIDLKLGTFTHADAGQMNLYLNYAREHLMEPGEEEPVGLILCSDKDDAVVHYAMGGIQAKVFASRYRTVLPDPDLLRREILATQHALETRATGLRPS